MEILFCLFVAPPIVLLFYSFPLTLIFGGIYIAFSGEVVAGLIMTIIGCFVLKKVHKIMKEKFYF